MSKVGLKPKKYSCFTAEQQEYYNKLPKRQRDYVDFRGQGYSKTQSYKMAGYDGKVSGQAAYMLERRNEGMAELINILQTSRKAKSITEKDSAINQTINALAQQQSVETMLETIDGADGETARRIKFYRDIMNGTIKTVRETKKFNSEGVLVEKKIEKINDIEMRIKARKELDKILGLNKVIDIDQLTMGDITINIVDASKKEELEDSRNKVNLDIDSVEVIDGEEVVVEESVVENSKGQSKSEEFFSTVGDD